MCSSMDETLLVFLKRFVVDNAALLSQVSVFVLYKGPGKIYLGHGAGAKGHGTNTIFIA